MPRIVWITVIAYLAIFCSIPFLRASYLPHDFHVLFWILLFEHIVLIPLSIKAFMAFGQNRSRLLDFSMGALATAGTLFVVFFITVEGASDRGMGLIILLLFPLIEAALAATGIIGGLAYTVKRVRGQ